MGKLRAPRRVVFAFVCVASIAVAAAFFAPFVTPGYDASFTLAWGRDLVHGFGVDFTHPSSPTPHPLALLGGMCAALLPVSWAVIAAGALTFVAWLTVLALLGVVTFTLTRSRIAVTVSIASAVISAPIGLLLLGASSDVAYCAFGLGGVLLTLRSRYALSIGIFMIGALLRPEAVLLAVVPLTLAFLSKRDRERPSESSQVVWIRSLSVFSACLILAIVAWLLTGAAGGDLLIALHSANTNAEVNDNPRGPLTALTQALPGLATPSGWLVLGAAAIALIAVSLAPRTGVPTSRRTRRGEKSPGAAVLAARVRKHRAVVIGSFIGVALLAYLAQGLLGTPLVARYLLLPALLCIALATLCIPLASRLVSSSPASGVLATVVAVALLASTAAANITGWQDVFYARQLRAQAFSSAADLLSTDLARRCEAPFVVRSPALVAATALTLDRPLRDITVADHAGNGVLLQPLTRDAMELAGYGPMTAIAQQEIFPNDAPPRQSNSNWALYSSCQP